MAESSAAAVGRPIPLIRSLRGKSAVFLALLFVYSLLLAGYVLYQKALLLDQLEDLGRIQEQETAIVEADLAAFSAITDLFMMVDPGGREAVLTRVHRHFTQLQQRYTRLQTLYPDRAPEFKDMLRLLADTVVQPTAANTSRLREMLAQNKAELDALMVQNRQMRQQALEAYLARSDRVAIWSLLLGLAGMVFFGAIVAVFFGRLTRDLLRLHGRVGQIVQGFRGEPLQVLRTDEVGELTAGINEMADDLHSREQELEIERQKRFHQDKMGAIGHLAAGVVHEVGNPVAAILGLACESRQMLTEAGAAPELVRNLDYIVEYGDRLRLITEDLAAFNRPQHDNFELFDLNELVGSVSNMLRYDERWYGIELVNRLDPQLPAIVGVSDQLSQLLMNLIVNAFEATEVVDGRAGRVEVVTRTLDEGVLLQVGDNGCGIEADQFERVFDAFYTTKAQKGSGLGLLLCSSIASGHGGYIRLSSDPKQGTRVTVYLPFDGGQGLAEAGMETDSA